MLLSLVNPYLTKLIIDQGYGQRDFRILIIFASMAVVIFVLMEAFQSLGRYLNEYTRLQISFDLNSKIFQKFQCLPFSFFQNSATGEHLYKISYDIEEFSRFLSSIFPQIAIYIPKALLIMIILFFLDPKIAFFSLVLMPFLYLVPFYVNRRLKKVFEKRIRYSQDVFKRLEEILTRIQLIKAFGQERKESKKYVERIMDITRLKMKTSRIVIAGSGMNSLAAKALMGIILLYGSIQIIRGQLTLGSLSAISVYLFQLSSIQGSLAYFSQQVTMGMVSRSRIDSILQAKAEEQSEKNMAHIVLSKGNIEFQDICFGYASENKVFDHLSFRIPGGTCSGIAGKSGIGKSTLFSLILRLYKPWSGEIYIDDQAIGNIKAESFYQSIGVVLQDTFLWNDTIQNNIQYGSHQKGIRDVERVAEIAGIHDFIKNLEKGYHTVLGENACKISEGQRQRIAIARALIKKPRILIMDEALSSVGASLENIIMKNIRNYLPRSTIIVIAHRLSAIKNLDTIFFLQDAQRMKIGTHQELLANNQEYCDYTRHCRQSF